MYETNFNFSIFNALKKTLWLLAVPLLEYIVLRVFIRFILNFRVGWPFGTDFDYFIPVPIALFLFVFAHEQRRSLILSFSRRRLLWHLFFLCFFLGINLMRIPGGLWWASAFLSFSSAVTLFLSSSCLSKGKNLAVLFFSLLTAFSLPLYQFSTKSVWPAFAKVTGHAVCLPAQAMFGSSVECKLTSLSYLLIRHPRFSVGIGQGCAGGEAFLLFLFAGLILFVVHPRLFNRTQWLCFIAMGLAWMFFLNVLRIFLLLDLGILVSNKWGRNVAMEIVSNVFHTHLGWILYVVGIALYLVSWIVVCNGIKSLRTSSFSTWQPQEV